jgi:ATP synthase F1 gamma subunit
MATLRELRGRIKSVNSTKKITKAQELIATSKITKAQARVDASQPYADEITQGHSASRIGILTGSSDAGRGTQKTKSCGYPRYHE